MFPSVKYIQTLLKISGALGLWAAHPADCIQHLCPRVLAISLALCLSLLDDTAAMVKNRQKEQQDIVQFWSVCQQ